MAISLMHCETVNATKPMMPMPATKTATTVWGLVLREWCGTSRRTRILVATVLFLLIGFPVIVGYGNYLKSTQTAPITTSTD
jgi:hypothetical protein